LFEWLERLNLSSVTLIAPNADHPLLQTLMTQARDRIRELIVQPITDSPGNDAEIFALQAPYPDSGHRAAERAFSRPHVR
jgi:hypothetical protein